MDDCHPVYDMISKQHCNRKQQQIERITPTYPKAAQLSGDRQRGLAKYVSVRNVANLELYSTLGLSESTVPRRTFNDDEARSKEDWKSTKAVSTEISSSARDCFVADGTSRRDMVDGRVVKAIS